MEILGVGRGGNKRKSLIDAIVSAARAGRRIINIGRVIIRISGKSAAKRVGAGSDNIVYRDDRSGVMVYTPSEIIDRIVIKITSAKIAIKIYSAIQPKAGSVNYVIENFYRPAVSKFNAAGTELRIGITDAQIPGEFKFPEIG